MTHIEDAVCEDRLQRAGVDLVINALAASDEPLFIHVVGSCRDIAYAINERPDLFKEKCSGIYLNAGFGTPDPTSMRGEEYNVALNRLAYARIFSAPCPIYWMPCFESVADESLGVKEFATWWDFAQSDVLPGLPASLQGFFGSVLGRDVSGNWQSAVESHASNYGWRLNERRNMWCTAGFLHCAGLTVDAEGKELPFSAAEAVNGVFSFKPITVSCDPETGVTEWSPAENGTTDRYIFQVTNIDDYSTAMQKALVGVLNEFRG